MAMPSPAVMTQIAKKVLQTPLDKSNQAGALTELGTIIVPMVILAVACGICAISAPGTVAIPIWALLSAAAAAPVVNLVVTHFVQKCPAVAKEIVDDLALAQTIASVSLDPPGNPEEQHNDPFKSGQPKPPGV